MMSRGDRKFRGRSFQEGVVRVGEELWGGVGAEWEVECGWDRSTARDGTCPTPPPRASTVVLLYLLTIAPPNGKGGSPAASRLPALSENERNPQSEKSNAGQRSVDNDTPPSRGFNLATK